MALALFARWDYCGGAINVLTIALSHKLLRFTPVPTRYHSVREPLAFNRSLL